MLRISRISGDRILCVVVAFRRSLSLQPLDLGDKHHDRAPVAERHRGQLARADHGLNLASAQPENPGGIPEGQAALHRPRGHPDDGRGLDSAGPLRGPEAVICLVRVGGAAEGLARQESRLPDLGRALASH